jgi:transposase InsO family protein
VAGSETVREKKNAVEGSPSSPPGGRPAVAKAMAGRPRPGGKKVVCRYGYVIRRKAVQLHVEEGIPADLVAKELGISDTSVENWTRKYRTEGEAGLNDKKPGGKKKGLPDAVVEKIGELKQADPTQGSRRISQILRRLFFMRASPSTVQKHVKAKGLATPRKKKRRKQTIEDRRFEYSKPNQFWQSDITVFKILGKDAYIIGFIDDYSRFITGMGVYRSQSAESVIETYRRATGDYGIPEELLTDNGRQYASWRGKTKFQKELLKDHVHHIRSQPHHPQTLGKIERFWQTLKDEFLVRAKFDSFDEAQERLAYFVKHYNHHRPHQSLEGLCPADRFFEIRKEIKALIEKNIAANMEELALRGKPTEPFYMVGRVGDRSVVIETDKQKLSVLVDGREVRSVTTEGGRSDEAGAGGNGTGATASAKDIRREGKESGGAEPLERKEKCLGADEGAVGAVGSVARVGTAGDLRHPDGVGSGMEADAGGGIGSSGAGGETDRADTSAETAGGRRTDEVRGGSNEERGAGQIRSAGEVPGRPGDLDRKEEGVGVVPGTGNRFEPAVAVAGSGVIGYVGGPGAEGTGRQGGSCACPADKASARPEDPGQGTGDGRPSSAEASGTEFAGGGACDLLTREVRERGSGTESAGMAEGHPGGCGGTPHGDGGGRADGGQPQDVLREAGAGLDGDAGGAEGPADRQAWQSGGSGERGTAGGPGERQEGAGAVVRPVADPGGHEESLAGVGGTPANG